MRPLTKTHVARPQSRTACGRKLKGMAVDNKWPSCKACLRSESARQAHLDDARDRSWRSQGRA